VKRLVALVLALGLLLAFVGVVAANGGGSDRKSFRAQLTGFQEVPATSSTGTASLRLKVNSADTEVTFTLTFSGLQGGNIAASHIHIGQAGVNGGVSVFFCGGGGKPACPAATSGTVTGTFTAADVIGPTAQGFAAGDLASVLRAIRAGVTYANIHTANFPAGEIRGQIKAGGND
jgi:hypothetical protein